MSTRILVLISGRGSNLAALVEAARANGWPAEVVGVISNRPQAAGLQWAREQGFHAQVVDHQAFASREAFDAALLAACQARQPDLVVLAGFMRVLGEAFVRHYESRLINIHPSLLPAFMGLHTHRRALQAGVKFAGATAHYVSVTLDHGPVIAQAAVPVRAHDTEHSLAQRVLQAEHRVLPLAVGWHVKGELQLQDGLVSHRQGASQALYFPD
ncbi:MAG: phosphoribosylglycinamide formyltransferase [Betaproteobacteria bacterium]|nr:phosphoribosylglycinamide formyltransferase [Betaproteobacteria bacterium]NBT10262.1 phosphoribosylglycinamide formyltransferase [Betaproteobacteria bacterium]NBU49892.1 phosphoribosylglycinamide formyltransferase [Betaproteobacteria bacterium]